MTPDRFDHAFVQPISFDESISFYRDALGWNELSSWGGNGNPRGASLSSGGMTIVLAKEHPTSDKSKTHGINGSHPTLHLAVDNIDQRYEELRSIALFAPEATHWSSRWFVAKDPDGNLIAFEQWIQS